MSLEEGILVVLKDDLWLSDSTIASASSSQRKKIMYGNRSRPFV